MLEYYAKRAAEYDEVYQKPERQQDIKEVKAWLSTLFPDKDVLEVACGTGYWTQYLSQSAKSIYATDYNQEVLELASQRNYPKHCQIQFSSDDAYRLSSVQGIFNAGFAGFWLSHVPRQRLQEFIHQLHQFFDPGSHIVFIDNLFVSGSSTEISRQDEQGNTYQTRTLNDGQQYEVLKNFPHDGEYAQLLDGKAQSMSYRETQYYWIVEYEI